MNIWFPSLSPEKINTFFERIKVMNSNTHCKSVQKTWFLSFLNFVVAFNLPECAARRTCNLLVCRVRQTLKSSLQFLVWSNLKYSEPHALSSIPIRKDSCVVCFSEVRWTCGFVAVPKLRVQTVFAANSCSSSFGDFNAVMSSGIAPSFTIYHMQ